MISIKFLWLILELGTFAHSFALPVTCLIGKVGGFIDPGFQKGWKLNFNSILFLSF